MGAARAIALEDVLDRILPLPAFDGVDVSSEFFQDFRS
jgi:hypothetical protein